MEKINVYRFSLLGPGRWLFGPMMIIFGVGLLLTEKAQMVHRVANGGKIIGSAFDVVMWGGFALVGLFCLAWGIWMLQSDRRTWLADNQLHTVRGIVPMFHKRYSKQEIRGYEVSKQPVIVVFGSRATTMGSHYQVTVLLDRGQRKPRTMIIANCNSEVDALKIKAKLEEIFR
jgi:hypothetical protein